MRLIITKISCLLVVLLVATYICRPTVLKGDSMITWFASAICQNEKHHKYPGVSMQIGVDVTILPTRHFHAVFVQTLIFAESKVRVRSI